MCCGQVLCVQCVSGVGVLMRSKVRSSVGHSEVVVIEHLGTSKVRAWEE